MPVNDALAKKWTAERQAEYMRGYRAKHAEKIKAQKDAWYAEKKIRLGIGDKRGPSAVIHSAEEIARRAAAKKIAKAEYDRAYRAKNAEAIKKAKKAGATTDARKAYGRKWVAENAARVAQTKRSWSLSKAPAYRKRRAAHILSKNAARRHHLRGKAQPAWANSQELTDVYLEAKYQQMVVDHEIPLKHPLVCGLHVPANLQLLTAFANGSKGNKFDPEAFDAS